MSLLKRKRGFFPVEINYILIILAILLVIVIVSSVALAKKDISFFDKIKDLFSFGG